jgi:hypothetical protein
LPRAATNRQFNPPSRAYRLAAHPLTLIACSFDKAAKSIPYQGSSGFLLGEAPILFADAAKAFLD